MMNNSNNQGNTEQIAMVVGSPGDMSGATDDDDDNCPSSPGSGYEESSDLMAAAMGDEVTAQLAAAGKKLFQTFFSVSSKTDLDLRKLTQIMN